MLSPHTATKPNDASDSPVTETLKIERSSSGAETRMSAVDQRDVTIERYKNALGLARNKIQENLNEIAAKDSVIRVLRAELEDAKSNAISDSDFLPICACRRVDVDSSIWILFACDGNGDSDEVCFKWQRFESEGELKEFLNKPGMEPIAVPSKCMTPEECQAIVADSESKVTQIREEFRKYRIKTEMEKRRQESESQVKLKVQTKKEPDTAALSRRVRELMDEVQRLQTELAEKDRHWNSINEKQTKEIERLKRAGSEAEVAFQWRQRYEQVARERDEVTAKLEVNQRTNASQKLHSHHGPKSHIRNRDAGESDGSNVEAKNQYLRNLLKQYLATDDSVSRKKMESAISLVLDFTPSEQAEIRNRKQKSETWLPGLF